MTEPNPQEAPDLVALGAQTVAQDPKRLGMVWGLRIATIVSETPLTAMYDGDTVAISVIPMMGGLATGTRVYVTFVPPSGNYVTGIVPTSSGAQLWAETVFVEASATSILLNVPSNLTALDIDWTLRDTLAGFAAANVTMRINADATGNYAYRYIEATNVAALAQIQGFGVTAARVGTYATGGATATRFGNGRITFPAWNAPHSTQLGYLFTSSFENAVNNGWYNTGGGFYGGSAPYTTIELIPQATSLWAVGSQVYARGYITP